MRVLVTGSEGFIGRHMIAALRAAYEAVEVHELDPAEQSWAYGDMRYMSLGIMAGYPCHNYDYDLVIHAAALVDGRETIENKAALLGAYNAQLDGALFEWALKAQPGRIVYFSSSAVYPADLQCPPYTGIPMWETYVNDGYSRGAPDATYGWTKAMGERVAAEVRNAGVPVTVVRPFSGYGEDQDECYPFPAMIARAKRGDNPFTVWGDGKQVRDFVHVDDICGAVIALVEAAVDGPVNIGTGRPTSMDQLARECMVQAGYVAPIRHLSDKPAGVQYRVADTTRLRQFYTPTVSLEQGVERALRSA